MHYSQILLFTAMVKIKDSDGRLVNARALLDNGSQSNFISESIIKELNLKVKDSAIKIKGISQQVTKALKTVSLKISSRFESFTTDLQCIVLPAITQRVPNVKLDKYSLGIPRNITLADPQFHMPLEIDLLLGAEKFWEMICVGQIKLGKGKPILQKTLLGWIVAGKLDFPKYSTSYISCNLSCTQNLDDTLRKFWQIENIIDKQEAISEDSYC